MYRDEVLADSPSLYYRFDETSGTVAANEVSGALSGTYVNSPTLGVAGALTDGNRAVLLDKATDHITVADNAASDLAQIFSIELWFKRTSNSGVLEGLFLKDDVQIDILSTGAIQVTKPGAGNLVTSSINITDTNWHHLVVTKSGSSGTSNELYLDNVVRTGTTNGRGTAVGSGTMYIGSNSVNYSNVTLDEFALYSTALSAGRITAHYNAAFEVFYEEALGMVGA